MELYIYIYIYMCVCVCVCVFLQVTLVLGSSCGPNSPKYLDFINVFMRCCV
jgi:preprotein translocase subunit SecG